MGLTAKSTGSSLLKSSPTRGKGEGSDYVIALAGNPNVGKSTVFNHLTGLHQHTGNWPGKTISNAKGVCRHQGENYTIVDLPGTYSLLANSEEEKIARDFICFGEPDVTVVVADATCLERNLNLILQTIEITEKVVVCVNLLDEAGKKKIQIDLTALSSKLGVPVVGTSARGGKGLDSLMDTVASAIRNSNLSANPIQVHYDEKIEATAALLEPPLTEILQGRISSRWAALKLLDGDTDLLHSLQDFLGYDILEEAYFAKLLAEAKHTLLLSGFSAEVFRDSLVTCIVKQCERICRDVLSFEKKEYAVRDRRLDHILTSRRTGIPIMLLLLFAVLWLTLAGANYPSALIASLLFAFGHRLSEFFLWVSAPQWVSGILVDGVYRTLAWVISVMLPPMAIFFPLFTLLEDAGYLPRIAFTLDHFFRKANAHGKQALTMCMGFGCNAAGVVGCRIIDSPRERLIAIITNTFVPCNGRFPTLLAIIIMFFAGTTGGVLQSALSALLLTGVILFGIGMTFFISKLLSKTILKGLPSSFQLELPPYRRPQIGRVIVRSVLDRTLFVLGRAVSIAAPVGLMIWLLANIQVGDASLMSLCASFLDPFARFIGLDGTILLAFILGFPANEIVIPIVIMCYMATGKLTDYTSLSSLHSLFVNNGWTTLTAVCFMLFSLLHWPCGTTCLTIRKETQSMKWTLISFAVPTATGIIVCALVTFAARLIALF